MLKDLLQRFDSDKEGRLPYHEKLKNFVIAQLVDLPSARELLEDVSQAISVSLGKSLMFDTTAINSSTKEYKHIYIELSELILDRDIPSVIIHELGEAHYLSNKMPVVVNTSDDNSVYGRLTELFSHPHCRKVAQEYGLEAVEGTFRSNCPAAQLIQNYQERCETSYYVHKWERLVGLIWYLVTFPELLQLKHEFEEYAGNAGIIERVLEVSQRADTY